MSVDTTTNDMAREHEYLRDRPQRDYVFRKTLSIDWGSQAVRAKVLFKRVRDEPIDHLIIHTPGEADRATDRTEMKRQFASDIYPFDNKQPNPPGHWIYPGNNVEPGRQAISSKLAMYAVVGLTDEFAAQSGQIRSLIEQANNEPQLKQNIRIGIQQILLAVLREASKFFGCDPDTSRGEIDAIALTIPAQWAIEFEEEYGQLLTNAWHQVFPVAAPQFIFLSEGQTNMHYAFYRGTLATRYDREGLKARHFFELGRTRNAVLVIDAGGHSTNTSLVTICDDDNQLEIRPDHGAIGGTALWGWHVVQEAREAWKIDFDGTEMPLDVETAIMKTFYNMIADYRFDLGASFVIHGCAPGRMPFVFSLKPEEFTKQFNKGFDHAFKLIEDGLQQLKALETRCERIEIVIGGGSAKGVMWSQRMNELCNKYQVKRPVALVEIDHPGEHNRLAGGANYALANAKSVAQFVDKAAFGLALTKQYMVDGHLAYEWDSKATMLWAQGRKWTRTVKSDGSQDFKVICQPEFDNPQDDSVIDTDYRAYDLLQIPCRKRGKLRFEFDINLASDTLELTVKKKLGRAKRFTELGTVQFSLWVPPGSRTLQIWECEEEIKARVAAAFPDGQQPAVRRASNSDGGSIYGMVLRPRHRLRSVTAPPVGDDDVEMSGMDD
ncbi:hypothetical protein KVR01_003068 [Diaporthe batatas]|uniref:uncharacterized protein n=1 Tax=Diaporthe batatas TaxID=748121 RepID=UPI001D04C136|nr:uncharacterized protein KVR01_003068 [Diaporthe batatas]KAG8167379.1 hypothetical protein KVR01_003068 [Diaporthe batatas]